MQRPALQYDGKVAIAVGRSRTSKDWSNQEMDWSALADRLSEPRRTFETAENYFHLPKSEQGKIKDVGGFVGGTLSGGRRKAEAVAWRSLITLDLDNVSGDPWRAVERDLGCAACLYTTHSSTPQKPRYRLVMPLARPVHADEYVAIARRVAGDIGIDQMDDSTYEPSRLMYWPSTSCDGHWRYEYNDGPWLDPDAQLARYADWRDPSQWPRSGREDESLRRQLERYRKGMDAGDGRKTKPGEKLGWVGAFCRAYTVPQAIEAFLSDIYTYAGRDRYTYTAGSTVGGLTVYDDGAFAYSFHGTDPAGGQLLNAFDLVRIHKFSTMDAEADPGTPMNRLPSYQAMVDACRLDEQVRREMTRAAFAGPVQGADEPTGACANDDAWLGELALDKRGSVLATSPNLELILEHDAGLAGGLGYDVFRNRPWGSANLPWREKDGNWTDADDASLRVYVEKRYNIYHVGKAMDALSDVMQAHRFHSVRDYLDGLSWDGVERLDTLLIDWLGADDTPYTRAVTRKALVGAVARIYEPGIKHDHMLVLIGAQGAGKSTLLAKLGGKWFSDSLRTIDNKDAYELLQGAWIIELAELSAMRKAESESIKQFLSKQNDMFRASYGKRWEDHQRECAFFGTTNDAEFIRDSTGGRRFWPVMTDELSRKYPNLWEDFTEEIRGQVWAEAKARYKAGEPLYLVGAVAKAAKAEQEMRTEEILKTEPIRQYLDMLLPDSWDKMSIQERREYVAGVGLRPREPGTHRRDRVCVAEIFVELFGRDLQYVEQRERREVMDVMRRMPGWKEIGSTARFGPYGIQKGFYRCCKPDQYTRLSLVYASVDAENP